MLRKFLSLPKFRLLLAISSWFLFPINLLQAEKVIISEFMANNENSVQDGYGETSDWIEFRNLESIDSDLSNFFLTDDPSNLQKWKFPNQTIIKSNSYLLIFASAKAEPEHIDPDGNIHTNFAIDNTGEYLALINPDGQSIIQEFNPSYASIPKDISYGTSGFFLEPTPGATNAGATVKGFVEDTKFSHDRGIYSEPFNLKIKSKTENSTIYYTEDGTVPEPESSLIYKDPILIDSTKIIRAIAYKKDFLQTNVDTHSYIFPTSVIKQKGTNPELPRTWGGKPADYEMDPEIVNDPDYSELMIPSLEALPSLSIAINPDDFYGASGIYQHPKSEGERWERAISVELLTKDGTEKGFQVNSGMRIQGGSSRNTDIPKHSFSLRFRKEYGSGKLNYPLFKNSPHGETAVQKFDYLQLRGGFNFGWTHRHYYQSKHAQYNRDQFANDLFLAMGNYGIHGRWTHLYINGLYWGIYHIHERPDADFMNAYFGEKELSYDAINSSSATNGSIASYNKMVTLASNLVSSPQEYENLKKHLHVESFIDYMILNFYIGNRDWDGHNWRAAGNGPSGEPFRFFPWDSEFALSPNNAGAIQSPNPISNALLTDVTNKNGNQRPTGIHQKLKNNNWYRLKFADHIRKHLFNGGPLSPEGAKTIWKKRSDSLEMAIIAESARWGDFRRDVDAGRWSPSQFDLYTKNNHYKQTQNWIFESYFPNRTDILLDQLRLRGLYPDTESPNFSQHGGQVVSDYTLTIENPNDKGAIYYTTDGTDPHISVVSPNETVLVPEKSPALVYLQSEDTGMNLSWTALDFDESSWQAVQTGIGFERIAGDFSEFINYSILQMRGTNASCLIRIAFTIPDQETLDQISTLTLNMKYDDGYAAFINGHFAAGKNNPDPLLWNSRATKSHPDDLAMEFEPVDITALIPKLTIGENVLAIQGMNTSRAGSDFLIVPKLSYGTRASNGISQNAIRYTAPMTLSSSGTVKARVLEDSVWSALNEARFIVGSPAKAGNLVISEVHYNPSGPSEENEFIELMNITDESIELAGVSFSTGVTYTFKDNDRLGPMERLVITREDYEGQLDNGGERLTLIDAEGAIIESFRYNDKAPWFEAPDGDGPSLVRIAPQRQLDPELPTSWRPSADDNGNPESSDTTPFNGGDLINYALGNNNTDNVIIVSSGNLIELKYNTKLTADYAEVTVMLSDDLVNWQETKNITTLSQSLSNNLDIEFLIRFENQMHEENLDMKFIKLKVEVSP